MGACPRDASETGAVHRRVKAHLDRAREKLLMMIVGFKRGFVSITLSKASAHCCENYVHLGHALCLDIPKKV